MNGQILSKFNNIYRYLFIKSVPVVNNLNKISRCSYSGSNKVTFQKSILCNTFLNPKVVSNIYNSGLFGIILQIHTVIHREYAAVCSLIHRSGLNNLHNLPFYLNNKKFHSSPQNLQQGGPPKKPIDPEKPNKENEDDDKDKVSTLLAKAFLWMLTAYMVIAIISLMFPSSSQPEIVRYVSWNEFLYQMLAKGEVEEIIVRPDIEIVTIILHDGAVIKGKRVRHL